MLALSTHQPFAHVSAPSVDGVAATTATATSRDQGAPTIPAPLQARPVLSRRPKLSLQTSIQQSPALRFAPFSAPPLDRNRDSPTSNNTPANAHTTASIARQPRPTRLAAASSSPSASPVSLLSPPALSSSSSSSSTSSGSPDVPYTLPMAARSILRNSPLPQRHVSPAAARSARRIFRQTKRVSFSDSLVELTPTPIIEDGDFDDMNPEFAVATPLSEAPCGDSFLESTQMLPATKLDWNFSFSKAKSISKAEGTTLLLSPYREAEPEADAAPPEIYPCASQHRDRGPSPTDPDARADPQQTLVLSSETDLQATNYQCHHSATLLLPTVYKEADMIDAAK